MNQPTFGDQLRSLRQQRGLSLKKFARVVHFDPGYLSKIENGLKPPSATVASRCDAALGAGGALSALVPAPAASVPSRLPHEVRIPVVIDGRPVLLPIKSNGELCVSADGGDNQTAHHDFCELLSRNLPGSSAAIVLKGAGMSWQWEIPGGRAFGGVALPAHIAEASWSARGTAVIADRRLQSVEKFVLSALRGVIIATNPDQSRAPQVLLDVVAARKQISGSRMTIPQAFQADDLTLGILWALSNMDEALLNDDGALTHARRWVRNPVELGS